MIVDVMNSLWTIVSSNMTLVIQVSEHDPHYRGELYVSIVSLNYVMNGHVVVASVHALPNTSISLLVHHDG